MKRVILGCTLALACGALALAQNSSRTLRVFIWSDYIDPAVVKDFEKQFGAKVVLDTYESNEAMIAKLQGGGARYDVAVPSDYVIGTMARAGLLAELRPTNLPNRKNLAPNFQKLAYDPTGKYAVPYQYAATGIAYRADRVKNPAQSWSLIFGAEDRVRFVLLDDPREVIGAALKYLGFSLNSTDPKQLAQARDLVLKAKRKKGFVGFDGGPGVRNKLLAGEADLGQIYVGDALQGAEENPNLKVFLPKEGTTISVDNLVVLRGGANRDLAEKFVNFILDAKVGARVSNFTQYATPNAAARPLLEKTVRTNPALYPPASVAARLENIRDTGNATRLYDRVWTEIKSR